MSKEQHDSIMKSTYIHVRSFRLSGLYTKYTWGGGGGKRGDNETYIHTCKKFSTIRSVYKENGGGGAGG